jgi:hypothetical protein
MVRAIRRREPTAHFHRYWRALPDRLRHQVLLSGRLGRDRTDVETLKTAFSRLPPVHRVDLKGQQGVDSDRPVAHPTGYQVSDFIH